ncbi:MAG: Glu/Leu/Phe/Val dehydrogenase, partial [Deltaproteobacteria bacterium]|nr:Glu/Leu/Phe/Val dehydrogenase [Deltaproteobacteria bacterium]
SYLEWVQNRMGYYWTRDKIQRELKRHMVDAFHDVHRTSEEYTINMRIAAFTVAIDRVRAVSEMRGLYA